MNPTVIGIVVFACTFGGAMAGIQLGTRVPAHHRDDGSKDTVKLGIGLVATMTALILGLVTASAKSSFDAVDGAVRQAAVSLLTLDRVLARYGPEAATLRQALRDTVAGRVAASWSEGATQRPEMNPIDTVTQLESITSRIRALAAADEEHRWLQRRALDLSESLLEVRFQVFGGTSRSVPVPFLAILIFWLTITFGSFGLFAPRNGTVVGMLFVSSLSVAAAVFLVLEMDGPFDGVITVSPEPLRVALSQLNR